LGCRFIWRFRGSSGDRRLRPPLWPASLRLKGLYLAIATLAAHFITTYVIHPLGEHDGGSTGLLVPTPTLFGLTLDSDPRIFYVILACVIPATFFAKNLFRTKVGRAFYRHSRPGRGSTGDRVSLFRYKLLAFLISSFYAGIAGGLMAHHSRILFPDAFTLLVAIDYLAMIIIGGMGSILGSIFGAMFMTLLPEVLKLTATIAQRCVPPVVRTDCVGARRHFRPGDHYVLDLEPEAWPASGCVSATIGNCGRIRIKASG